jgi:hypothetical protein
MSDPTLVAGTMEDPRPQPQVPKKKWVTQHSWQAPWRTHGHSHKYQNRKEHLNIAKHNLDFLDQNIYIKKKISCLFSVFEPGTFDFTVHHSVCHNTIELG